MEIEYHTHMLEKPDLPDDHILTALQSEYDLHARLLTFLPLGADAGTAVYRFETPAGAPYFLKLRTGHFDPLTVEIPHWLHRQGLSQIIPPLETTHGRLWGSLPPYATILYPFVEGRDGYEVEPSAQNWIDLGRAFRTIHTAALPTELHARLPRETYSPRFRRRVHGFLAQVQTVHYEDSIAAQLAAAMRSRRCEITHMLARATRLAHDLKAHPLPLTLCHSDLHPGNLHLTPAGQLYIVDWDNPTLAPREHDLMFLGAGMGIDWQSGRLEALFFQGYGGNAVDQGYGGNAVDQGYGGNAIHRPAIAYYRYERILQDLAVECELILLGAAGAEDRERELRFFNQNFLPGGEFDRAVASDI